MFSSPSYWMLTLRSSTLGEAGMRWADVHLSMLKLDGCIPGSRPARHVSTIHATAAVGHAENEGWSKAGQYQVPDAAWALAGYDTNLMNKFLSGQPQAL